MNAWMSFEEAKVSKFNRHIREVSLGAYLFSRIPTPEELYEYAKAKMTEYGVSEEVVEQWRPGQRVIRDIQHQLNIFNNQPNRITREGIIETDNEDIDFFNKIFGTK